MRLILPDTELEYKNALEKAAKAGSINTLISLGLLTPFLSMREAFKIYGESSVKRWIAQGAVTKNKQGEGNSKVQLSRIELETAALASVRVG